METILGEPQVQKTEATTENIQIIKGFFTDFLAIFLILIATTSITIWLDVIVTGLGRLSQQIILFILLQSVSFAFFSSVLMTMFKSVSIALQKVFKNFEPPSTVLDANNTDSRILQIFLIFSSIIAFVSVRPVLQDIYTSPNDFYLTTRFVKYDYINIFVILLIAAVITVSIIHKFSAGKRNILIKIFPFFVVLCFTLFNYGPNFYARITEARAAWKTGNPNKLLIASQSALEAAKTDSEKSISYYWIGVAYNILEKPTQAKDNLEESVKLEPSSGATYSALAFSYIRLKDYKKATEAANKCLSLEPDYSWGYMALSRINWEQGNYKEAKRLAEKAQEVDPESREIRTNVENINKALIQMGIDSN